MNTRAIVMTAAVAALVIWAAGNISPLRSIMIPATPKF